VDELISYVERALDEMTVIVTGLGDDAANQRPDLPGANSPYVILRHCLGVMDFWGGHVVAGRAVDRDREAEFRAAGPVAGLLEATDEAKVRFRANAASAEPGAPVRGTRPGMTPGALEIVSQGSSLLHVLEEVTQHLGQMEITRDLLRRG
jgi:uncharacterized protein DUF664